MPQNQAAFVVFLYFFLFPQKEDLRFRGELTIKRQEKPMPQNQAACVVFLCFFLFSKKEGPGFVGTGNQAPGETCTTKPSCLRGFSLLLSFFPKKKEGVFLQEFTYCS